MASPERRTAHKGPRNEPRGVVVAVIFMRHAAVPSRPVIAAVSLWVYERSIVGAVGERRRCCSAGAAGGRTGGKEFITIIDTGYARCLAAVVSDPVDTFVIELINPSLVVTAPNLVAVPARGRAGAQQRIHLILARSCGILWRGTPQRQHLRVSRPH
eukprot:gene344-biopygen62